MNSYKSNSMGPCQMRDIAELPLKKKQLLLEKQPSVTAEAFTVDTHRQNFSILLFILWRQVTSVGMDAAWVLWAKWNNRLLYFQHIIMHLYFIYDVQCSLHS